MSLYVIVLEKESQEVVDRIEKNYPGSYEINTTCFLVRTDDLSDKVALAAGIMSGQSKPPGGAVFKLNKAYAGFASSSLWEWLDIENE